jgi:hypothetical protein
MFTDPSGKIKQAIEDATDALDYIDFDTNNLKNNF